MVRVLVDAARVSLDGSNFAVIAIDDPSPQALPVSFPWSCDQLP